MKKVLKAIGTLFVVGVAALICFGLICYLIVYIDMSNNVEHNSIVSQFENSLHNDNILLFDGYNIFFENKKIELNKNLGVIGEVVSSEVAIDNSNVYFVSE